MGAAKRGLRQQLSRARFQRPRVRLAVLVGAAVVLLASCFPSAGPIYRASVFNCTGGPQFWVTPPDVHVATFDIYGAAGGSYTGLGRAPGGLGGQAKTLLNLSPGDIVEIDVGCKGQDVSAAFPSTGTGGLGGASPSTGGDGGSAPYPGAGGGGASGVVQNVPGLGPFLAAVGGGGGGGGGSAGLASPLLGGGGGVGGGGEATPAAAGGASGVSNCVTGGEPGTHDVTGGAGGNTNSCLVAGTGGGGGTIGGGGTGAGSSDASGQGGGGGGGGWFGGGGGASGSVLSSGAGGGGGGSGQCVVPQICVAQVAGARSGDGIVVVYYFSSYNASVSSASHASHVGASAFGSWTRATRTVPPGAAGRR